MDEIPPQKQSLRYGNPAFRYVFCEAAAFMHACQVKIVVEVLCRMRAWADEIPSQKQLLHCGDTAITSSPVLCPHCLPEGIGLITCRVCTSHVQYQSTVLDFIAGKHRC